MNRFELSINMLIGNYDKGYIRNNEIPSYQDVLLEALKLASRQEETKTREIMEFNGYWPAPRPEDRLKVRENGEIVEYQTFDNGITWEKVVAPEEEK